MSMSKKQANKTIVYFRKRKTNETVKEVANVVASSAQQVSFSLISLFNVLCDSHFRSLITHNQKMNS